MFAFVQAKAAQDSRNDAIDAQKEAQAAQKRAEDARDAALDLSRKATAAAERQAEAAEKALPPAWGQARPTGDYGFAFDNSSGRHIVITSVTGLPEEFSNALHAPETPARVEYGDAYTVSHFPSMAGGIDEIKFEWHFEDDPSSTQTSVRRL